MMKVKKRIIGIETHGKSKILTMISISSNFWMRRSPRREKKPRTEFLNEIFQNFNPNFVFVGQKPLSH
jgi:hypothetical protein